MSTFNRRAYENSRPDGFGVLEVLNGHEATADPADPEAAPVRRFVPLRRTELRGEVAGPLASLHLTQEFAYSSRQCPKVLEAAYRFPLPGDATVSGVRVYFGEVEIRAELAERSEAETKYAEARDEGRQASLLTRESPDVFTLQVAGLRPDQPVTVETSYVQLAAAEGAGWSLRLPLTTAPRYTRGDEQLTRHAQGQPLLLLRDPGHRFALDLTLEGAATPTSPTHRLELVEEHDRLRVRLREGAVLPDRDFVLRWQPPGEAEHPSLRVLLHDDRAVEQIYFLALVAPPSDPTAAVPVAREVIVLVDHSGSMEGPKWEAADWAVKRFLSELTESDRFNLGLFHDTTRWLWQVPRPAGERARAEAVALLEQHRDSGGTELGVALEQALRQGRASGELARHILIVTDAEVTDLGRILHLAEQESRRPVRRRISVLCIDAAPNSSLALELAERGGGLARFLTSSPDEDDITTALDDVLADWAAPLLTGLQLGVDRPALQAAGLETVQPNQSGWSTLDLGDLPRGRPRWAAGRVARDARPELTFRLAAAGQSALAEQRIPLDAQPERPALAALFGGRRVLELELLSSGVSDAAEKLRRLGYEPNEVLEPDTGPPAVYHENAREQVASSVRTLLVAESLRYGIASSETAFVAVRTEAGQRVEETVAVANALPAGWSDEFLSAPATRYVQFDAIGSGPGGWMRALGAKLSGRGRPHARSFARVSSMPLGFADPAARRSPDSAPSPRVVFAGIPQLADGEAILFDSAAAPTLLPADGKLQRLVLRFPDNPPPAENLDPDLALLVFVDDPTTPRARARLVDLVRQGGERPLNLTWRSGERVTIVLSDPNGAWSNAAPSIEVSLG